MSRRRPTGRAPMAVELRCPDCRAKLKLKKAPDAGDEVECPECNAIFEAPDDPVRVDDDDTPPPRAKRRPADDDGDRPRKKDKKPKDKAAADGKDPKAPRKRKARKKETNKAVLFALIGGGVVFTGVVIFMLWRFFGKEPASYELLYHLPPDSTSVQGANLGHVRRYTEFYKRFESNVNEAPFKKAADVAAKAVGADVNDFIDYMATGTNSKGESGLVIKAKQAFDGSLLSKMPGARPGTADGRTYYTVDTVPGLFQSGRMRVFSPSPKLVVFAPDSIPPGAFNRMIAGTRGEGENSLPGKLGPIAKRATRGTVWSIVVFDAGNRPKEPEKKDNFGSGGEYDTQIVNSSKSAKAFAFKASVGSRNVKFEAILQFPDSDAARALRDRFRDSPLAKTDDASLDPPRYWKEFENKVVGNKKVGTELYSTLGATTSGDLFVIYAECETMTLMESGAVAQMVGKMTGTSGGSGGPPVMPGGGGPPPGMGAPPPAGGPPPPGGRAGAVQGGGVVLP